MGIFDFLKKKNKQERSLPTAPNPIPMPSTAKPPRTTSSTPGSLNLSKEESLQLLDLRKTEVSTLCATVEELSGLTSRVALVLDYSGSMGTLYRNGTVQSVIERILPIACQFDNNQELDLWIFETGFHRLGGITLSNFYDFVKREITPKYSMGGTRYAPVLEDVLNYYTKEEPSDMPTYVIFVTDGDNSDQRSTTQVIQKASAHPVFWQFVGIGNENFSFLRKLDEMPNRITDNANFFQISNVNTVSDTELYQKLLTEYPSWLKDVRQKGWIA